jgi:signal peptidase II
MRLRLASVTAAVVVVDHLTKWIVVRTLAIGESVPVIDGFLYITHVRNSGAAFGLLRGMSGLLALAALVGVLVFAAVIVRHPPPLVGVAAAFVAGGALGNLLDRVVREWPFRGTVVDFVDFEVWPSFNVADMAISVGAGLFVLSGFLERNEAAGAGDTTGDGAAADAHRDGGRRSEA